MPQSQSTTHILTPDDRLPPAYDPDGQPMRAIVYVRLSPRPQSTDVGLEEQIQQCTAWCEARHLTIAAIYIDDKLSGRASDIKRPGWQAAKHHAAKINAVLLGRDLSRLARSARATLELLEESTRMGFSVAVAFGLPVDTTTAQGRMLTTVIAAISQYFAEAGAERTKEALAYRKANGLAYSINAPFGYRAVGEAKPGKKYAGKKLVRDSFEQRIIRWFVWRSRLGFKPLYLSHELEARGYKGRQGRQLTLHLAYYIRKEYHDLKLTKTPILDPSDWLIERMAKRGDVEAYAGKQWSRGRRLLVLPRWLVPTRLGEWPHPRCRADKATAPVMDADGYLTVSHAELLALRTRMHYHQGTKPPRLIVATRKRWFVPKTRELLESLPVYRNS